MTQATSEEMFRLYARIAMLERYTEKLEGLLEQAADREVNIVAQHGEEPDASRP